jgi:tripartite ATP-independent transporter DctP family solute receptor
MGGPFGFSQAFGAEINLRYAGDLPVGNHLTRGQEYFAQRVNEISKGQVRVQVFPAGQLFSAKDYPKALPAGAVDMAPDLVARWSGLVPSANFAELPLFWDDWSHAWRAYDSEMGEILAKGMETAGVKVLFWLQDGVAGFATKFPLRTAEDLKGKRIRSPSELASHSLKALGGAPAFMGGGEVYMALQRGTVDGGIASVTSFCDRKYYEVTKYVTEPGFMFGLYACLINLKKWNELPPEAQKALLAAGKDTQEWARKEVQKVDAESLEELKKHGMEVYYLPKAERELWRKAFQTVYDLVVTKAGDVGPKMFDLANKAR